LVTRRRTSDLETNGYKSFVRNGVVQIPKLDTKPNPNPNPSPNPVPIRFGQTTLRTSRLLP